MRPELYKSKPVYLLEKERNLAFKSKAHGRKMISGYKNLKLHNYSPSLDQKQKPYKQKLKQNKQLNATAMLEKKQ